MTEFLQIISEEWAIRALIASTLVGLTCGVIGCFMVLRNMSLIGDALSHAILPGIFVAFVLVGYSSIGFFTGTLMAALISAVAITWIQENVQTKNDAAIGIIFTFMFSLGVIGISYLNNQEGVHLDLKDFLFGNILGVSNEDLMITFFVALYSLGSIALFYRYLFISTFQPTIAATMGISVKLIHYFLMLLLSFAVVAALRTVGIILVVAMLITPAASALLLSSRLKNVLVLSGIFGLSSALFGLLGAIVLNTTPGPAMCVAATLIYLLAVLFSPSRGLVFNAIRKTRQSARIEREDIIKYMFKSSPGEHASVDAIVNDLGLESPAVRRHLKYLIKEGFLMENGKSPELTAKGRNRATDLVRAHRLWEKFLVEEVGLKDSDIHEDAEKYEHILNPGILDQLDAKLGFPTIDPHGSPIPGKKLQAANPLLKLRPKARARISKDQISEEIESKLWELGLTPNTAIQVIRIDADQVKLRVGNKEMAIPARLAGQINIH